MAWLGLQAVGIGPPFPATQTFPQGCLCSLCLCLVTQSCPTLCGPMATWTIARHPPLPIEFSRQGYWSGLPFPTPEDHSDPGIELVSLAFPALAGRFCTTSPTSVLITYQLAFPRTSDLSEREQQRWELKWGLCPRLQVTHHYISLTLSSRSEPLSVAHTQKKKN